jgi:hypothetical protein
MQEGTTDTGLLQGLIDRQLAVMLPGDGVWPAYSHERTAAFWRGWYTKAPWLTRMGLVGCVLVVAVHGWWSRWVDGLRSREAQLAAAAASRQLVVAQSVALLKAVAGLAYFSDAEVQVLGRGGAGRAQVMAP